MVLSWTAPIIGFGLLAGTTTAQLIARTSSPTSVTSNSSHASPTSLSPCGVVSSMSSIMMKASRQFPTCDLCTAAANDHLATSYPTVPPSIALACLESVPLDVERSLAFVDYIAAYLEFESTLAYLKDPPPGYLVPGVDIMGGLANITENLQAGLYTNQWNLEVDLHELINILPYNGHLSWQIPLLQVFQVETNQNLVSVSTDGLAIPELYVNDDLMQAVITNGSLPWTPSPVVTIDGMSAVDYLESLAATIGHLQDPDAQYNFLFSSIPFTQQDEGDSVASTTNCYSLTFLSDTSNWGYKNATSVNIPNRAVIAGSFEGIDSSAALFSKVDLPLKTTPSASTSATASTTASVTISSRPVPTVTGYPYPVQKAYDDIVAGYFLNGSDVSDTAVLAITSFEDKANATAGAFEMQSIIQAFLADCVVAGKTKLIIDLSANGGGIVMNAYDLFKQLFPANMPFGGSRYRDHPVFKFMGSIASEIGEYVYTDEVSFPFQIQENLDRNLQPFPDWQAEYGPSDDYDGDNFTSLLRFNLSDPIVTGITVTGYGDRANVTSQPFKAGNIVMLTDGICSSTCTILADLMKRQGGVRNIVVGGRPENLPMQAVGGVKGSSIVYSLNWQQQYEQILGFQNRSAQYNLSYPTVIPALPTDEPPLGQPLGAMTPSTNARNAYPAEAPDGPPLQFIYEAANCRLFYKFEDTLDITQLWTRVANVVWGHGTCVPGSTVNSNNTFPLLATDIVLYNPNVNSNATFPKRTRNANNTGPPSTVLTSSVTATQSPPSTTSTAPAMFTGGTASLFCDGVTVLCMMAMILNLFLNMM